MPALPPPRLVVVDVLGTLFSLGSLAPRLGEAAEGRARGPAGPADLADLVWAEVLRDTMAVAATGAVRPLRVLAEGVLRARLPGAGEAALRHVLDGLAALEPHPDALPFLRRLAAADVPVVALSNGAAADTRALLRSASAQGLVRSVIGVDDAGVGKPGREPYLLACHVGQARPVTTVLVSAHPWDLQGGRAAGLRTAWVERGGAPWPPAFDEPDARAPDLVGVADALLAGLPER